MVISCLILSFLRDMTLYWKIYMGTSKLNYLSHTIQNELIALLSQKEQEEIVTAIKQAEFYSVIMEMTQDITKVDQLSQVFRYVTVETDEKDQPTEVKK